MGSGWIKLHRELQNNSIWQEDTPFNRRDAWIDLLLLANHESNEIVTKRGQRIVIREGQMLTSVRKLSDRWHWGKDRTLRYLLLLESCNMIERNSATYGATLLTIVNWGKFQNGCDSKRDSDKDTHKDSDKDTNKPRTRRIKNDKEIKNIYAPLEDIENEVEHGVRRPAHLIGLDPEFMSDDQFEEWQRWRIENGII